MLKTGWMRPDTLDGLMSLSYEGEYDQCLEEIVIETAHDAVATLQRMKREYISDIGSARSERIWCDVPRIAT